MTIKHRSAAIILGAICATPAFAHDITLSAAMISSNLSSDVEHVTTTGNNYDTASDTKLGAEFALGYFWKINSGFGLEFDFYYDYLGLETKQSSGAAAGGHITHSVDGMIGLRMLPMLNITQNTKIYLDMGFGAFEQTIDGKKSGNTSAVGTKSADSIAFRYGGGISTMLYDNISLSIGYAVIDGGSSVTVKSANDQVKYSATPTIQYFGTAVTWHFGL